MLTILPEADGLIAYEIDANIDGADVDRVIAHIDDRLRLRSGPVNMLVIVHGIGFVTPAAIAKEFKYAVSRIRDLGRFRRVAIVSDLGFVRSLVGAEDLVVPRIDIKAFCVDDEDIARLWLKGGNPAATF